MDDHQNEAQLMSAGSDHGTFVLLLGRKVNARTPKCQNIQELGTALVQGWQQYPQHRLRRLIHGMRRRVQELYRILVDLLMDDHQNEAQLMSAGSDHGIFVLLKSNQ
jgi:hypothetical protein